MDNENFIKEINGEQITSTDLFEYFRVCEKKLLIKLIYFIFQSYCAVFASGVLPTPKDMLEVCT